MELIDENTKSMMKGYKGLIKLITELFIELVICAIMIALLLLVVLGKFW